MTVQADLYVHGCGPGLEDVLVEGVVTSRERSVDNIIGSDGRHQLHRQSHLVSHVPGGDVTTGSSGTDDRDGGTHRVSQLEVAVDEMTDLHEDPGPVDAVDGAESVLLHILRAGKHRLDGNIQLVRVPVHGKAMNVVVQDGGHLQLLDLSAATVRQQNHHINPLETSYCTDGSAAYNGSRQLLSVTPRLLCVEMFHFSVLPVSPDVPISTVT